MEFTEGLKSVLPVATREALGERFTVSRARISAALLNPTRVHYFLLSLALGAGLAIRVVYINALGYNSDEAVYAGQGAAIVRLPHLTEIFPVFRAHPLLFQFLVGLAFKVAPYDWVGRLMSVLVGLMTIMLVYFLGRKLYGRQAGLYAAMFMAVMPYHVIVTRQVLLDGPMTFCATLALYLMVRFGQSERPIWLIAAGAAMGLTFLAKEIGVLMIGSIYVFLALSPELRVRIHHLIFSLMTMVMLMAVFPLSTTLTGAKSNKTAGSYFIWQLFRRPNHTWDFYPTIVPPAMGILIIVAALFGLWWLRRQIDWREKLLVAWIIVPVVFFQLWPTKGFQYLLPTAPAFVMLAVRTITALPRQNIYFRGWRIPRWLPGAIYVAITLVTLIIPSWNMVKPRQSDSFLAGMGGIPGGREMGLWVRDNVPENARFMTVGPSMANIIKYYGYREAYGLSISPNPLHRNPSYEPVYNPDFQLRTGDLQYVVWDSFSAGRSTFFSEKLLYYVERYHGRVVHMQTVTVKDDNGEWVEKPVIIIYEVHP